MGTINAPIIDHNEIKRTFYWDNKDNINKGVAQLMGDHNENNETYPYQHS